MPDVNLNSDSYDVGKIFKILVISVTFGFNAIVLFGISSSQVLPKKNHDGRMAEMFGWKNKQ